MSLESCKDLNLNSKQGNLYVISGPSGVGKGTLVSKLLNSVDDVWLSVSATTRLPREGEVDGINYQFLSREEFLNLIDQDGFLEWAEYAGNLYGTPIASIIERLNNGVDVILEIEVQGALQVKEIFPDSKLVFIEPPSIEELERRLLERGTEAADVIQERLNAAKVELDQKMEYDISIVNDDIDLALDQLVHYMGKSS